MTTATDRQMSYLRTLVERTGTDLSTFLVERGISETGPSKSQASDLISELAPPSIRHLRISRRYVSYRCTHEDYPCCGCER